MNTKIYEFEAVIKKAKDMDAAYIEFPFDCRKEFSKGRVFVKVLFDGIEYSGSLVNMGTGCHVVGIRKDIRKTIGKDEGDIVKVILKEREK